MSIQSPQTSQQEPSVQPHTDPKSFWAGRSELIVPALVLALAIFLSWQTATMDVLGSSVPGPQFFPTIVCVVLYLVVIAHTIQILRAPRENLAGAAGHEQSARGAKAHSDWKTMGMVLGGVAGFILILPYAGCDHQRRGPVLDCRSRVGQQESPVRREHCTALFLGDPAGIQCRPGTEPAFGILGRTALNGTDQSAA